jgi:DNA primase
MAIAREIIEDIRTRVSIHDVVSQSVRLQSAGGGRYKGLCPFHRESTPSFTININQNMFYCFGCTIGGDIFKFVMHQRGLSFYEAVEELAESCGIMIEKISPKEQQRLSKRQLLYKVCQEAAEHFIANLWVGSAGSTARGYLIDRGFSEETTRHFQLGFAKDGFDILVNHLKKEGYDDALLVAAGLARFRDPDRPLKGCYSLFRNRLIIPIRDPRGRIIAFGARTLTGDNPKYINSPETDIYKKSKTLYGLSFARPAIQSKKNAILVEGYFDSIALHQAGFKQAIATCGTALTTEHLKILRPMTTRLFTVFDSDKAGQKAIEKSYPLMIEAKIASEQIQLREAKDPDEFIQRYGAEAFEDALKKAEPTLVLKIQMLIEKYGPSPMGKNQVVEELAPLLKMMSDIAREGSVPIVASYLGLSESSINDSLRSNRRTQFTAPTKSNARKKVTVLLHDLLWLCIHQMDEIRDFLQGIQPDEISSNEDILYVFVQFLMGKDVHEIVSSMEENEELRCLLMELLMEEQLYTEQQALPSARQIILRMGLKKLERSFREKQKHISEMDVNQDVHRYLSLLQELQTVRKDIEKQRDLITQKNSDETSQK